MDKFIRILFLLAVFLTSSLAWAQDNAPVSEEDTKATQLMNEGVRLVSTAKFEDAIPFFDNVAKIYEDKYREETNKLYSARWDVETLMYLLEAANAKTAAKVVSANWAYAYYLKAYALVELKRTDEAKVLLNQAIALSPHNAQFLSELGNIFQSEKDWPMALKTFQSAQDQAKGFSPPSVKNVELSRAMRGIAFVYVEINQLDDAESLYQQCLELDKNDTRAMNELRYIKSIRAKQTAM